MYISCSIRLANAFLCIVISAPRGVSAQRISATQFKVTWPQFTKDDANVPVLCYTIKYYPLISELRSRREVKPNIELVNTTNNITIEGVDPILYYNVSVAANTEVGFGNFSKEITVGCKYNSIFVVIIIIIL